MMETKKNSKVKVHVDGGYAFIIWAYLLEIGKMLNWGKLFEYILQFLSGKTGDSSLFVDKSISSVFMGDPAWTDERREKFRHELLMAGIDSKLRPLKMVDNRRSDGSRGYKEDGVDALNIAHIFFDAFVGAGANTIPTVQYSYLVLFAGDSDFASTFDLLHALGIKIVVVYFDVDEVHRPTSELILSAADYAISLKSLLYDRGNALAQSVFGPTHSVSSKLIFSKPTETTNTGIVKFVDCSNVWGIISGPDGDYHFSVSDVKSNKLLTKGCKVQFDVLKRPVPNDGCLSRGSTNGKATDVTIIPMESSCALKSAENDDNVSQAKFLTPQVSERELKELVSSCRVCSNGFALLSEVGAIYAIKYGKPERPLKEILRDYPTTFEFTCTPAAGVRIK